MQVGGVLYDGVGKYNDSTFGVPMPHYTRTWRRVSSVARTHCWQTVRYLPAMTLQVPNPRLMRVRSRSRSPHLICCTATSCLEQWQQCHGGDRNVTNAEDPIAGASQLTSFGNTYTFLGRVFRVGVDSVLICWRYRMKKSTKRIVALAVCSAGLGLVNAAAAQQEVPGFPCAAVVCVVVL